MRAKSLFPLASGDSSGWGVVVWDHLSRSQRCENDVEFLGMKSRSPDVRSQFGCRFDSACESMD